jgi:hypothetical protein
MSPRFEFDTRTMNGKSTGSTEDCTYTHYFSRKQVSSVEFLFGFRFSLVVVQQRIHSRHRMRERERGECFGQPIEGGRRKRKGSEGRLKSVAQGRGQMVE